MERMIADALAPVLADIRATRAPEPTVIDADWDPELQSTVHLVRADGSGQGVGVLRRTSRAIRVVQAADGVQKRVIETLWSERRATSWPVRPAHPDAHQMSAVLLRKQPTWQCPELRGVHIRISALQVL